MRKQYERLDTDEYAVAELVIGTFESNDEISDDTEFVIKAIKLEAVTVIVEKIVGKRFAVPAEIIR